MLKESSAQEDHKGEKSTSRKLENEKCPCNSLTNEMIREMLLNSPIKGMIEKFHAERTPQFKSLPERSDVVVLNTILNMILSGRYSLDKH